MKLPRCFTVLDAPLKPRKSLTEFSAAEDETCVPLELDVRFLFKQLCLVLGNVEIIWCSLSV